MIRILVRNDTNPRVSLHPTMFRTPPIADAVPTVTGLNRSDNVALRPQSVRKRVKKIGRTGRAEARSVRKWTSAKVLTLG